MIKRAVKLSVPDNFVLPKLNKILPDTLESRWVDILESKYFDKDGELAKLGVALRFRKNVETKEGLWTLKSHGVLERASRARREEEFKLPDAEHPPEAVVAGLPTWIPGPFEVVVLVNVRRKWLKLLRGERVIVGVALDRVTVLDPKGKKKGGWTEVIVRANEAADLKQISEALLEAGAKLYEGPGKFQRAMSVLESRSIGARILG